MYISANILYTYVLWCLINTERELKLFMKIFACIFIIVVANGIVEFLFQENIWFEWLSSQTDAIVYHSHINDIRMGYGRCCSFFDFCIPFGDFCAIFFAYYLFLFNNIKIIPKKTLLILMIISIVGIVLSNSRAAFLIFFLSFLQLFVKINKSSLFIFTVLFIGILYMWDYVQPIYDSIFNSNQSDVQGSNAEMRQMQLLISINEFLNNPIFGNGMSRTLEIQKNNLNAAGLESHLFILMINFGLCGIIAYIVNFFSGIVIFNKGYRSFPFFLMSLWVIAAFTSLTTGIDIAFPIILSCTEIG